MIKTPLRYPGGKAKAIKKLKEFTELDFKEYREPFLGGGSLFIYLKQEFPDRKFWVNDLNPDVFCFWKAAQLHNEELVALAYNYKRKNKIGKDLFRNLLDINPEKLNLIQRAARFFVLNRISFSGTTESGGYSESAFKSRFTDSSIERVRALSELLDKKVKITNHDFSKLLINRSSKLTNKDILVYLDPPYYVASKSKLYGKKGNLHLSFDHLRFSEKVLASDLNWFISYDNSEFIRDNFAGAKLHEWQFQYGMNNYKKESCEIGKELIISNY
ncbi:MAG: DNA adenine methylase [Candidatus Caenarcaniphilales bacterium]|nr:DNA adenine methylase [Candidatus Caenarcaniphilales bacterium]